MTNKRPTMPGPREIQKTRTVKFWSRWQLFRIVGSVCLDFHTFLTNRCRLFESLSAFFFAIAPLFKQVYTEPTALSSYGHTTVKAPHPIRTAKLSTVGPDQYFGRGLQGNLGCCMSFCLFFLSFHSPLPVEGTKVRGRCPA